MDQENTLDMGYVFLGALLSEECGVLISHTNSDGVLYGGPEGDLEHTVDQQLLHLGRQTPYPECSTDPGEHS